MQSMASVSSDNLKKKKTKTKNQTNDSDTNKYV